MTRLPEPLIVRLRKLWLRLRSLRVAIALTVVVGVLLASFFSYVEQTSDLREQHIAQIRTEMNHLGALTALALPAAAAPTVYEMRLMTYAGMGAGGMGGIMSMLTGGGGSSINLEVAAAANTEVVRSKRKAVKALNLRDDIEDILISLGKQYHLIRPVRSRPSLFYYLVLDRSRSNLAMARYTLAETEREIARLPEIDRIGADAVAIHQRDQLYFRQEPRRRRDAVRERERVRAQLVTARQGRDRFVAPPLPRPHS